MKTKLFFFFLIFSQFFFAQTPWEILNPKPSSGNNLAVKFSNNKGYIINDSKQLLFTEDNGVNWKIKREILSGNDIKFASNVGYLVGDSGYVLRSTDSGVTWNVVTIGSTEKLNSVSIFNDKIIISSPKKIYSSSDGIIWTSKDIAIPNPFVSETVFTTSSEGHLYSQGKIYKTKNGGDTWTNTYTFAFIPNDLNTLYFKNQNEGYISVGAYNFFKTTDGGDTWTEVPQNLYNTIRSIYFVDQNTGYAVGDYSNIYKTTDNGATWVKYGESYFGDSEKNLTSVCFETPNIGFAVGKNGIILKTENAGLSWKTYSFTYNSIGKLQKLNNNFYVKANDDLYKSLDLKNWQKLKSPTVTDVYFYLVDYQVISDSKIYALVGTSGSSYFTVSTDGGQSWTVNEGSNAGAGKLQFLNENVGFRSGSGIKKTVDGGLTWTTINTSYFYNVYFLTENVGFGMKDSKLYKTIDGASTWNLASGEEYVSNYQFLNLNEGFIVGNYSLLKTKDGGATWEKSPTNKSYQYANFENSNIGFLSGQYSEDYSYTDNGGATWKSLAKPFVDFDRAVIEKDFFVGGGNGKLAKTNLNYNNIYLQAKTVSEISAQRANVFGYGSVNNGNLENLVLEYSTDSNFSTLQTVSSNPAILSEDKNGSLIAKLDNLIPGTTYYVRFKGNQGSSDSYSNVLQFKTKDAFTENMIFEKIKSTSVLVKTSVRSNDDKGIQNIEIVYGTDADNLNKTLAITPNDVLPNDVRNVSTPLTGLEKNTTYYLKIKFSYNGAEILGKIYTVKTLSGPTILINPYDSFAKKFSGYIQADEAATNIEFQYGTQNFETIINANPSEVPEGTFASLRSATEPVLNLNQIYYSRIKATQGSETLYSNVEIYNPFSPIVLAKKNEQNISNNSVKINGLINTNGYTANNLKIVYGLAPDALSTSVSFEPSSVTTYETAEISAPINNLDYNKTYYYRFSAQSNTGKLTDYLSEVYSFKLSQLGTGEISTKKLNIYPNPAHEYFKIDGSEMIISVNLLDLQGRTIRTFNNNFQNSFDVSSLNRGIYLISIKLKNGKSVTKKLIKN